MIKENEMMSAVAKPRYQDGYTAEQIELIKRTIAKGATDDELKLFMAQCQRTGLDPFDRQIYFIKRKQWNARTGAYEEVGQTQTSIDGFRVIAERTSEMDGQEVVWYDENAVKHDVWLKDVPPSAALVLVYRKGCTKPFPGIARFSEYAVVTKEGKLTSMWRKMPATMIAKCAEALALRKAFPRELSGLYTRDEMGQAENESKAAYVVEAPKELKPTPAEQEAELADIIANTASDHGGATDATDRSALMAQARAVGPDSEYGNVFDRAKGNYPEAVAADAPLKIVRVEAGHGGSRAVVVFSNGEELHVYTPQLAALAEQIAQEGVPVVIETRTSAAGKVRLEKLSRLGSTAPVEAPTPTETVF